MSKFDQESIPVIRVSQVIDFCNELFSELPLRVEGEVAGFSISRGQYVFFDLKDESENARLSCFMMAFQVTTPIEDGMRVVVSCRPGLYKKSGQFRLTVSRVEPKGEGSLKRAFELLRHKLDQEGLFSAERKRPLPRFVAKVGIISSSEAAGFGDFRTIALQRLPGVRFYLANVAVQGKNAEEEICRAFDLLNERYTLDAIALIRGGGSLEDLHAFNSEPVARAIIRSKAPVIVGVGHERDITIADFCADLRAATPSNAAQLLLPTTDEVRAEVLTLIQEGRRRVGRTIQLQKQQTLHRSEQAKQQIIFVIRQYTERVRALAHTVDAISPERTLQRGYTITCGKDGHSLTSNAGLQKGDRLTTRFQDGLIYSSVIP